jgi:8-oxo-dGTP pyrophosphatase MutT (NUDIX family)
MLADFNIVKKIISSHVPKKIPDSGFRRACVLMPLLQREDRLHLLFTKRTDSVEHHKGQISFPGGMVDDTDTSPKHTALRELEEEIGIKQSAVTILGQLDDIHIPSGFVVTPIVGFINSLNGLSTNKEEVSEVFFISLEKFFDSSLIRTEMRELQGMQRQVYFYDVWKEPVWGATAHIIKQFTDLVSNHSSF